MSRREIHRIAPVAGYPARQQNGITALFQWVDFPDLLDPDGGPSDSSSTKIKSLNLDLPFLNLKCNKIFTSLKKN
jgi:hypothetical protein